MNNKLPARAHPIRLQQAAKFVLASQRTLSPQEHNQTLEATATFLDTLSEHDSIDLIAQIEHGIVSPEEAQDLIELPGSHFPRKMSLH